MKYIHLDEGHLFFQEISNFSSSAPSQPTNLTATIGKNFINLSWDAPKYANSIIKYYKVKYRSITTGCAKEYLEKYTNASDTSVELTDLYSNIEYEIELSAGTVKYGNATVIRRRTVPDCKWDISNIKLHFIHDTRIARIIQLRKIPKTLVILF